jgi:hypothetical protein
MTLLLGLSRGATAQVVAEPAAPYPDPALFARGLFFQGEAGVVIPLGVARQSLSAGPAMGLLVGYELARFVALQLHAVGSTHAVDVAGGPQLDQLFQILQASAELKLSVPLGQWAIFAQGGAGRARFSSNLLGTAGLTEPGVPSPAASPPASPAWPASRRPAPSPARCICATRFEADCARVNAGKP